MSLNLYDPLGVDRCDICGKVKMLYMYWNKDIGKLLDIEPYGRPEFRCDDCIPPRLTSEQTV